MPDNPDFSDWLAICNVKADYCRLLDTKDWESWKQLFTEDVVIDTTDSGGNMMQGRDPYVAFVSATLSDAQTCHHVHAPQIVLNGNEADVIWAMQDRVKKPEWALTGYGHYDEKYVRTDDGWKIARLTLTRLFVEMEGHSPNAED